MKMSKKWFSVILVMALSMGLIVPVFAQQTDQTEATVTIIDGDLTFDSATENIVFNDIVFSFDEDLTATSINDIELQITDNRFSAAFHTWDLQANLTGFTELGDVRIQAIGGAVSNASGFDVFVANDLDLTVDGGSVPVSTVTRTGAETTTGQGTSTITYPASNITVTVPRESLSQAGTHTDGLITWTLSDTASE